MDIKKILSFDLTKSIYGKIFFGGLLLLFILAKSGALSMFSFSKEAQCERKYEAFISNYNQTQQMLFKGQVKESYIDLCVKGDGNANDALLRSILEKK